MCMRLNNKNIPHKRRERGGAEREEKRETVQQKIAIKSSLNGKTGSDAQQWQLATNNKIAKYMAHKNVLLYSSRRMKEESMYM